MFSTVQKYVKNRHHIKRISVVVGLILALLLSSCASASPTNNSGNNPSSSAVSSPTAPEPPANQATSSPENIQHPDASPTTTSSQITNTPPATISANTPAGVPSNSTGQIKTVFLIVMENHNWSDILNNSSAPYINSTLLPQASFATQYFNPPGNHPSEPNYIWLEAGSSLGINNDSSPSSNHQSTTDHLVTYLDKAGVTWKAYAEDISGTVCPLKSTGLYAPKHTPMVFFDNVTGKNDPNSAYCIAHIRPFTELQTDLNNNTVAQYNFITPNLCNDMHNSNGCQTSNAIKNGDTWLSEQVPVIMASDAYKNGGVIFITWDESENGDNPIGMILLSPLAKGGGYSNSIHYTHSSTLRTVEEIFNITPLLGDAANATDLSDLFKQFP
jgi:hypothetical protein